MSDADYKLLQRGEKLVEIGRHKDALVEFNKYLAVAPDDYHALCSISLCHLQLGELKSALNYAHKAVSRAPENEWAYRLKSIIFRFSGQHAESLDAARKSVAIAPYSALSLQTLAYAQINNFLLAETQKTLELMLEIAPENPETFDAYGYLALKYEDYESAEKNFLRALNLAPESEFTLNNLGYVYLEKSYKTFGIFKKNKLGREAKENFLSALKINPNSVIAKQNLTVAENNPYYFASKKNRLIIRTFLIFVSLIIFCRVISGFIPWLVNNFRPYKPLMFYLGINIIFGFFLVLIFLHLFFLRRANIGLEKLEKLFSGDKKLTVSSLLLLLVPQFVGGLFFAFLEIGLSSLAWMILIITGIGFFYSAVKIFEYYDNRILE